MIKKNVLLSVATITMMCFIFAGCAGGSDNEADEDANKKEKTEEKSVEEESAEATETSTKEMTEDIYVEILAQQMYLGDKYDKKADEDISKEEAMKLTTEMGEKMSELYDEHGVSQDDFDQFAEEIMEDMEAFGAIMDRANERAEELIAEDEK